MNSSFHNGLNQVASLEGDSNSLLKFLQENNRELSPSNNKHSLSNRNGIVFNQNLDIEKLLYVNKSEKGDKSYDLSNDKNKNNKKPEENLEFEFTISKSNNDQNESTDLEEEINKIENDDKKNLSENDKNNKINVDKSTSEFDDEIIKYFGENMSSPSFLLKRSQSTSQVDTNNKILIDKNMDETISTNTTVTPAPTDSNNNNESFGYGSVRLRSANRLSGLKKLGNLYKQFEDDDFVFNNNNNNGNNNNSNNKFTSNKNNINSASQRIAYIDESFDTHTSDNNASKTKTSTNSTDSLNTFTNLNKSKNRSSTSLLMNNLEKTNTNSSSLFGTKSGIGSSSNTNAKIDTDKTNNMNSNNNSINTSVDCCNNSDLDEDNFSNLSSNKSNCEQNNKPKIEDENNDNLTINNQISSSRIDSKRSLFEATDKKQPNSNGNSCVSIDNLNDSFMNSNTSISASKPKQSRFRYSSYLNEIDLTNSNNQLLQVKTNNSNSQTQNSCNNNGIVTDRILKFENQFLSSPKSVNTSVTTNSIMLDLDDSISSNSFQPLSASTCISISNSACVNNTNNVNNLTIKKVNPIDLANTTLTNNNNDINQSDQKVKTISKKWEQIVNKNNNNNNNGSSLKSSASFSHGYTRPTSIAQKIEKFTQKQQQSSSNTTNNNQKMLETIINKNSQNGLDTAKLRMNSGGTNSDEYYEASKDDGFETQSNASSSHNNHENEVNDHHECNKEKCDSNTIIQLRVNNNTKEENKSLTLKSSNTINETSIDTKMMNHNNTSSSNKSTSLESISSSRSPQPRDLKSSLTNVSILSNKMNNNNNNTNNNNNNNNSNNSNNASNNQNANKPANVTTSGNIVKRMKCTAAPISRPVSLMHPPSVGSFTNTSSTNNHTTLSSNFHATKKALNSYIKNVTSKSSNDNIIDSTRKKSGSVSALYLCDTASTKAKKAELKQLKEAAIKLTNNLKISYNNNVQNPIMNRRNSLGKKSFEKLNSNNLNYINIHHDASSSQNRTSKYFNHHSSQSNVFERLAKSNNQVNNLKT